MLFCLFRLCAAPLRHGSAEVHFCLFLILFSQASSLFIWVQLILLDIHRDLCLCTSFLVRIAGGGAAPSLLHPHPLLFSNRLPLLPTILFVFRKHHRLFGFILSLLISIEICAYVFLSWYALRGEALRPCFCFDLIPT